MILHTNYYLDKDKIIPGGHILINRSAASSEAKSSIAHLREPDGELYHFIRFGRSVPVSEGPNNDAATHHQRSTRSTNGGGSVNEFLTRPMKRGDTISNGQLPLFFTRPMRDGKLPKKTKKKKKLILYSEIPRELPFLLFSSIESFDRYKQFKTGLVIIFY